MIVDLNLQEKSVIVIGGGNEAQKRINSLMNQECNITVISDKVTPQITKLAKLKKIQLKKQKIQDTKFISEFKPDIIITTTNDKKLNQNIINAGKKKKIITYSSDNPEESDFSNPAIIDFEKMIQIAIFTGGRSPAMSKKKRKDCNSSRKKSMS
ncbi:sirohydrochlorin ferrochelatase protein [Marine Group I thaumarchaeote SCGC RSA3]|uniref:precorrin-2 dehydrogenase n=1 Tax=Marine Group I thaumarchaeote SCGC RSA3 TaxID=1503183 RepID=A0A087RYP2_9ARCH|nr:sirohydrochlorin ferrochelatase protein [Marine Group I thaumarchaeote SCGC RSA3]